jgi:hypothetical protein
VPHLRQLLQTFDHIVDYCTKRDWLFWSLVIGLSIASLLIVPLVLA